MSILGWILASTAAYWLAVLFVPVEFLRELFYITSVAVMVIVAVTWGKAAIAALWRGDWGGPAMLIIGVWLMAIIVVESRVIAVVNYYADRPDWLYDSPIFGFIAFQITCVGILKLWAVGRVDAKLPERYERNLWISGLIGAFISGLLLSPFIIDLIR